MHISPGSNPNRSSLQPGEQYNLSEIPLALEAERFHPKQGAHLLIIEDLERYCQGLSDPKLRQLSLEVVPRMFGSLPSKSYELAWSNFKELLGRNDEERGSLFREHAGLEPLALKFLSSIKIVVRAGANFDELLLGLIEDRRESVLMNTDKAEVLRTIAESLGLDVKQFPVVGGLTVTSPENLSWGSRSKLGMTFLVKDWQDHIFAKLRITEQVNPGGQKEWDIGVVCQDTSKPRISQKDRYLYYPGEIYPQKSGLPSWREVLNLASQARKFGAALLDVSPAYYHLYRALSWFGAEFDPAHPSYAADCLLMKSLDNALDRMQIRGLKARSWAVHGGRVMSPGEQSAPLTWRSPRMVWRAE